MSFETARLFAAALAVCASAAACGGGGATGAPNPPPGPRPQVAPASVRTTVSATPVPLTVSEAGYAGSYTVNAAPCAGTATVVQTIPVTIVPGTALFAVTGIAPGSCTVTFTDELFQSVGATITVLPM